MKVPNLGEMIDSAELEHTPGLPISSMVPNKWALADLKTGLDHIEYLLLEFNSYGEKNPTLDLCIMDTIDKWVFRERHQDIHYAVLSVVFEVVKGTDLLPKFENYFNGGPYPMGAHLFEWQAIMNAVVRMLNEYKYAYQGEA